MINRQNWIDVRHFLNYQDKIQQNGDETIRRYRSHLRHVLEWADSKPLTAARSIDPTLPAYLLTIRGEDTRKPLSPASLAKALQVARLFFRFAKEEWPTRYKGITKSWIETLQPSKRASEKSRLRDHEHYKLEDLHKLAGLPVESLREQRDRAAACFLFLSGMRVDAFASMPISCVDLEEGKVYQLPERGVRTKNTKAAVTFFLPIPELMTVVKKWDLLVRSRLSPDALWFTVMTSDGDSFTGQTKPHIGRGDTVGKALRRLCKRAEIPYLSPHKMRHGHIVYGIKNAHNLAELKAISQNVMHESVDITDRIYGGLSGADVQQVISGLQFGQTGQPVEGETIKAAAALLAALKNNPEALQILTGGGK